MSARATYQFNADGRVLATYFIRYDGHPEGACEYFSRAISLDSMPLTEAFMRANLLAELTLGHEERGDTEYRYTVYLWGLREPLLEVSQYMFDKREWKVIWFDTLCGFINKYSNKKCSFEQCKLRIEE